MNEDKILHVLVDEHARNWERDASYAALNSDLYDEDPAVVAAVVLDFIDRLICDGVVSTADVRQLLDEPSGDNAIAYAYRESLANLKGEP